VTDDPVRPRVSIVIPNWNGMAHLPECLAALRRQTFPDFESIIVDNGSTDESLEWLGANAPWVRVIPRQDNGGFAVAVNVGIRAARGDYVALLNNDTAVDAHWLEELIKALERTGYDCAASRMVLYDRPGVMNAAGDVFSMVTLSGRNRGLFQPADRFNESVRVLNACAGASIYRRSFFEDVGLFDEQFFLLSEDTDIGLRALIAGKRCIYVPTAVVRHKLSASIKTRPNWDVWLLAARNEAIVVAKDFPVLLLPLALLLWPVRSLRALPVRPSRWHLIGGILRHFPRRFSAELRGLRMGWTSRDEVWSRAKVSRASVARWILRGTGSVDGAASRAGRVMR